MGKNKKYQGQAGQFFLLCKRLCWFLPVLAVLVGFNLWADPANLFQAHYEQSVADILLNGSNAAGVANMDDRKFMKDFLTRYNQPVGTLVLGSSHALQITRELTNDPTMLNAGVTNADIRDMISWYLLLEKEGKRPRRVIWVADCWHTSVGSMDGRAYTDEYAAFMQQQGLPVYEVPDKTLEKCKQLFSPAYFQSGIEMLMNGGKRPPPYATSEQYAEEDMRRADGSYCYSRAYREKDQTETDVQAYNLTVRKPQFALYYTGHSIELETQIRTFFHYLKMQGVEVTLLLPPFHPDFYRYMKAHPADYEALLQEEDFYKALAHEYSFACYGSYDPSVLGLTNQDFYDGMHCTEQALYHFYPGGNTNR